MLVPSGSQLQVQTELKLQVHRWLYLTPMLTLGWWLTVAVQGQDAEVCEGLEGERLTICQVCTSIRDQRAKEQCLEVAEQLLDRPDDAEANEVGTDTAPDEALIDESVLDDTQPQDVRETSEQEVSVDRTEPTRVTGESATKAEEEKERRRFLFFGRRDREVERPANSAISDKVYNAIVEINPDRFSSVVVGVRKSDYNRAVIALKNGIVFEVKRARQSRLEEGDVVIADKHKGFGSKNTYLLYGKGAGVEAIRVRCEHIDPSKITRDRCEFASSKIRGW